MKLTALMPVRNDGWVLGLSLRVALLWCDQAIILLHSCTDNSRDIVEECIREHERGRIIVIHDSNPDWPEMQHRQLMLEKAREHGATHIAIVDCDEILSSNLIPHDQYTGVRGYALSGLTHSEMLQLPLYYLRDSISRYHLDGIWGNRIVDLAFRDDPRLNWSGDTFHSRAPRGVALAPYRPVAQGEGGIMHLWAVTERRIRAKSALYKCVEAIRWPDKRRETIDQMYSWAVYGDSHNERYGTPGTWAYAAVPDEWWHPYNSLMKHLDVNAEPWQTAECQRLVAKHGREYFHGLDLFGIA